MNLPLKGMMRNIYSGSGVFLPALLIVVFLWLGGHATIMGAVLPLEDCVEVVTNTANIFEEEEKSQVHAEYSDYLHPSCHAHDPGRMPFFLKQYGHHLEVPTPPPDEASFLLLS